MKGKLVKYKINEILEKIPKESKILFKKACLNPNLVFFSDERLMISIKFDSKERNPEFKINFRLFFFNQTNISFDNFSFPQQTSGIFSNKKIIFFFLKGLI